MTMLSRPCTLAILIAASGGLATANAAEWALDPKLGGTLRYDDNLQMRTSGELATWEASLKPELAFLRSTEVSEIRGDLGFNFRRFDKDDENNRLDTDDYFLKAASHYRTERQRWGLTLDFTKDTTLDSELEDTGIVYSRVPRTRHRVAPDWTYVLDERNTLTLDYSFTRVRYDSDPAQTYFYDYDNQILSLGHEFAWSPRTRLTGTLALSRYRRDDDTYLSENGQLQFSVSHTFTERWSAFVMGGARRTKNTLKAGVPVCAGYIMPGFFFGKTGSVCVDPDTLLEIPFDITTVTSSTYSSGGVFSASLQRGHETGGLSLSASRTITPSTRYGLILADRVTFTFEESLTETLSTSVEVSWYSSSDTASEGNFLDRRYLQFGPRMVWRFARDWRVVASYRYRQQRYNRADTATGNAVVVTLDYGWPKIAVAR